MIWHRKAKGSTLFLVSLIIGLIVCVVLCGIGFNYLLFMRARAQYAADAMALTLATKFNTADRIGELNNLQVASRELIFLSRDNCDQASATATNGFTPLCYQLLDRARSGQSYIVDEHQNQINLIAKEVQDAVLSYNRNRVGASDFSFFGMRTFEPEILRVDLGRIVKVNSNIRDLAAIPELEAFDRSKGYIDKVGKLYTCDVNAKLPEPDSDLDFRLSSLPAYVGNTNAPSRNTNAQVFVSYGTIFAGGKVKNASFKSTPSAVQIQYGMDVVLPWDQSKIVPITLVATAITGGASLDSN